MLKMTLPIPPSVNKAYGMKVQYMGGRAVPQRYLTNESRQYKEYVSTTCKRIMKENNINFLVDNKDEFVQMDFHFFFDKKRKDADNTFKLMFDGMVQSGLIPDDDIILYSVNDICIDRFNPRVEVFMYKSNKKGIFFHDVALERFKENNCTQCKRGQYKRKCSVLSTALENRIEPEIDYRNLICNEKVSI